MFAWKRWLLASLLAALVPLSARAQDSGAEQPLPPLIEYKVKSGDTVKSVAKRLYGDAGRTDLILKNNDLGAAPYRLREGQVLHVPADAGPDARVTSARGVELTPPVGPARDGRKGDPLRRGFRVATTAQGSGEITFSDDTRVQLGGGSLLVVVGEDRTSEHPAAGDTTLLRGLLRARLDPPPAGQPPPVVVLASPAAKVRLGIGEGMMQVDEDGTTRVAVISGEWRVRGGGKEVRVQAGSGARVQKGRAPSGAKPLPQAPVWSEPPPRVVLAAGPANDAEVTARFAAAGDGGAATAWHIQVARDDGFSDVVLDSVAPAAEARLVARALAPGRYVARVMALNADQLEGPPGPVARFEVREVRVIPGGTGRVATVDVPAGFFCSLDGASRSRVSSPLPLAPGRGHVLRCSATLDGPVTEVAIDAGRCGPLLMSAAPGPVTFADDGGRRYVVLRLTDALGQPVSGAAVRARATEGATIGDVREDQPGAYGATVRWQRGTETIAVKYTINDGAESFDAVLPPVQAPGASVAAAPSEPATATPAPGAASQEPAAAAPAKRHREAVIELALLGSMHISDVTQGTFGQGVGTEVSARFRLPRGVLAFGLRPLYEHYAYTGDVQLSCVRGAGCEPGAAGGTLSLRTRDMLTLTLPLVYRVFGPERVLSPYFGAAPQLLLDWAQVAGTGQGTSIVRSQRLGLLGFAGLQLRTGAEGSRGALFFELAYRHILVEDAPPGNVSLSGVMLFGGYRIGL